VSPALSETDLLWRFIAAVPFTLPDVRVFRRNILNVQAALGFRAVNGIKGQGDAEAIVRGGLHIEIETKSAKGVEREAQERWREYCERFRIPHLRLRAKRGETPDETVARWVAALGHCIEVTR
jgi:hypothetical protein